MNKSSVRRVRVELKPIREVLCTEEDEKKTNKEINSYCVKTSTSNKKNKTKVKKVYLNQLNNINKDNSRNHINNNNNTCSGFKRNKLNFSSENKTIKTNSNKTIHYNNHTNSNNNNTLSINNANKKQLLHNNKQNKLIHPLKVNISFRLHKPSSHNHSITNIVTSIHNDKLSHTNRNRSYTNYNNSNNSNNNSHFYIDNESQLNREYRLTMFTLKHKLNSLQQSDIKPSSINASTPSLTHKKSFSNTLSPHPSIRLQKKLNYQNAIRVRVKTGETINNNNTTINNNNKHPIERNKLIKPNIKLDNERLIKETLSTKHKTDAVKLKPHDKHNKSNTKLNPKLKQTDNEKKHKDEKCLTSLKKTHLKINSVLRNGSYFSKGQTITDFNSTPHNTNPIKTSKSIHYHSQSFNHKGSNIINNVLHI